jgi:hypothetical protein
MIAGLPIGQALTSISIVNPWLLETLAAAEESDDWEQIDADDQNDGRQARICGDGPCQAARDCEQGRKIEPRWGAQGQR